MNASRISIILAFIGSLLLSGCGGGGGGGSGPPPPPAFTISITPSSLSIAPGTSASATVSLQPQNGFDGTATVTLSGLPTRVTVSPASPFSLTTNGQVLQFRAGSGVADGTYALSFQATSGTLSASASLSLLVAAPATFSVVPSSSNLTVPYGSSASTTISFSPGAGATNYTLQLAASGMPGGITAAFSPNPVPPNSQSTLMLSAPAIGPTETNVPVTITATRSTDAAQRSGQLTVSALPSASPLLSSRTDFVRTDDTPASIVYDSTHNQVFVCNPFLYRIDVVSPATGEIVKSIQVPGAEGLTLTPDNSLVYAAGPMQKLVAIDTASLSVVRRYIYPQYNGNYIEPVPIAVSDSSLLMLGYGSTGFGMYDPTTGTITEGTNANNCMLGGDVGRSADGTKVFIASETWPGYISLIDTSSASCVAQKEFQDLTFAATANQNGTQFAVGVVNEGIYFLDANLNILGTAPAGGLVSGMVYSPDGHLLYIVSNESGYLPLISTVDTQTFQLVGTAPAYAGLQAGVGPVVEIPHAAYASGMIFGAADHGLALDDSTFYHTFSSTAVYPASFGAKPAEGNRNAATPVSIDIGNLSAQPTVWFGAYQGTNVSLANDILLATAPPATNAGPVNIRIFDPDGAAAIMPQAFSYGPSAITYGTRAGGPQGGATADLFGNGFSADVPGAPINVQIGGQAAPVTEAQFSYNDTPYPLYLQHLQVTVPPGSPGAQGITIDSPSGATTISQGFHFLESLEDYPSSDTLIDVLYDQSRQQLYLSAGNHVDVFSLSTNTFLAPIVPPSLGGKLQLAGLALTPDSSKLLVANLSDQSVAIINPDNPSTATAVHIGPSDPFGPPVPYQIAPTSLDTAFVDASMGYIYVLNLGTLQVSLDNDPGLFYAAGGDGIGNSISSSRDGSKVCIATPGVTPGSILIWSATTNAWVAQRLLAGPLIDGAVSGDGNVFTALGEGYPANIFDLRFLDSQANLVGVAGLPDFLIEVSPYGGSSSYLYGHRLNDSGSLVYIPFPQGVDIFDVQHGDLRERILLTEIMNNGVSSVALATRPVHNMAIDETGQHIFMITNKGLTIAQLDSVPLSIGSVTPNSGPAGTQVKIRGSGFVAGSTASANGTSAAVDYVDADTLQVTLPSLPAGAVQIVITNPDGQTYSLDDSFTVH